MSEQNFFIIFKKSISLEDIYVIGLSIGRFFQSVSLLQTFAFVLQKVEHLFLQPLFQIDLVTWQ